MKKIAFIVSVMLLVISFAVNVSAVTFKTEYITEAENVSVLYSMFFNHYSWGSRADENISSVFYRSSPVTFDHLTQEERIAVAGLVFLYYEGTAIYDDNGKLPLSHFKKKYEDIFGKEFQYVEGQKYPFVDGERSFVFFEDTVLYDFPNILEGEISEDRPVNVRTIYYVDRYVLEDNKLYIFDKYALVRVSEADGGKVPVYSSSDSTKPIGYLDYDETADKCEFEDAVRNYHLSLPYIIMEYYPATQGNYFSDEADISGLAEYEEILTEYVHTFERDGDGNWYWVSSSPADMMPEIPDTADNSNWMCFAAMLSVLAAAAVIYNRRKA